MYRIISLSAFYAIFFFPSSSVGLLICAHAHGHETCTPKKTILFLVFQLGMFPERVEEERRKRIVGVASIYQHDMGKDS